MGGSSGIEGHRNVVLQAGESTLIAVEVNLKTPPEGISFLAELFKISLFPHLLEISYHKALV